MVNDTIADMLTRIRNANLAKHQIVQVPSTKMTRNIVQVLKEEGFIEYFEEIHEKYKGQKVKVHLVSLDFSTQIEKKLIPFIQQRNLKPEVVVLDDPDANSWINKVSEKWSGAIPATLIFKGDKRSFFEQSFESAEEIWALVEELLE